MYVHTWCLIAPFLSVDRTSDGQSTHWLELSRNGTERATISWRDWSVISHARWITDNFVMLEWAITRRRCCCKCERFRVNIWRHAVKFWWSYDCSMGSTEAEVMSLDTGLRMEGLLALSLWGYCDWRVPRGDPSRQLKSNTSQTTQETTDHVRPNAQESSNRAR